MLRESTNKVSITVELPAKVYAVSLPGRISLTAVSKLSLEDAENHLLDAVTKIVESIDGVQLMVVS